MSGEGGGALIGGVILIAAAPYILAGAAAVGAVVGLIKLGSAAAGAAERHHHETELKVERCSEELSGVYSRLDAALKRERDLGTAYYENLERDMQAFSKDIRCAVSSASDTAAIHRETEKARAAGARAMGEARTKEISRIRTAAEAEKKEALRILEDAQRTKAELVDWKASTAAARAAQKAMSEDLLRDAKASVDLLQKLTASNPYDQGFAKKAAVMADSLRSATENLNNGIYQSVVPTAQLIITRSASLAIEHEEEMLERDQLLVAVEARLEALREELKTLRVVEFKDDLYGLAEEDLDEFTQGEYSKLESSVAELLGKVAAADKDGLSRTDLSEMLAFIENELAVRKDEVITTGHKKLMQYYERLHALEVISDYMKENGYEVEWTAPVGDDLTQKMVVCFKEPVNGNTISVSLDEDASTEDIGRMAMEVMFYYASDRPVTEEEKSAVRKGMENALHKAGLQGTLSCTGSVGKEAENQTLKSAEEVRKQPVRQVL